VDPRRRRLRARRRLSAIALLVADGLVAVGTALVSRQTVGTHLEGEEGLHALGNVGWQRVKAGNIGYVAVGLQHRNRHLFRQRLEGLGIGLFTTVARREGRVGLRVGVDAVRGAWREGAGW